jgi:hypothetical protein
LIRSCRARTSRQPWNAAGACLLLEECIERWAGFPLPAPNLAKHIADGSLVRRLLLDCADFDGELIVDPDAHRMRRVAPEGLQGLFDRQL